VQLVDGWTSLAERVGPLIGIPVASALVVTVLWALTGWSWFDLGPWPWALGALPVVGLALARLLAGLRRRQAVRDAIVKVGTSFSALGRAVPDGERPTVLAALRLARARFGREGLQPLDELLDEQALAQVRGASDPLMATLARVSRSKAAVRERVDAVHVALDHVDAAAVPPSEPLPSAALTTLFLATLPVGLVTTTGWWTFAGVGGVALAFMAIEAAADGLERHLGLAGGVPVDRILDTVDVSLSRGSDA